MTCSYLRILEYSLDSLYSLALTVLSIVPHLALLSATPTHLPYRSYIHLIGYTFTFTGLTFTFTVRHTVLYTLKQPIRRLLPSQYGPIYLPYVLERLRRYSGPYSEETPRGTLHSTSALTSRPYTLPHLPYSL